MQEKEYSKAQLEFLKQADHVTLKLIMLLQKLYVIENLFTLKIIDFNDRMVSSKVLELPTE